MAEDEEKSLAEATCPSAQIWSGMIDKICWSSVFPIYWIGGTIGKGDRPDKANTDPVCVCWEGPDGAKLHSHEFLDRRVFGLRLRRKLDDILLGLVDRVRTLRGLVRDAYFKRPNDSADDHRYDVLGLTRRLDVLHRNGQLQPVSGT